MTANRCPAAWWLCSHDPEWTIKRTIGKDGLRGEAVKPHALEWHCLRCGKLVSETCLTPSWSLLAKLRRQVPWARDRSRKVA